MRVGGFKTTNDGKPVLPLAFSELDRVKLKKAVTDKGRKLAPGSEGTVVLCHGTEAYEVEFDAIDDDFFQISAKDLEKA